jgi:hypothetical protein
MLEGRGPFKNFDFIFCFLEIDIEELFEKIDEDLSIFMLVKIDLINHTRVMSPLIEYLYLKPLYSKRGGSTIRAEPFKKSPGLVFLRQKPL